MEGTVYDFALAWPTVTLSNRDMYALDLAAYILGEGESSRLVRKLKYETMPLVLDVGASSNTPHFVRGYFAVTRHQQAGDLAEGRRRKSSAMVYRLRDEEVSQAELAKAKKQKAAELVFQHQTVQQQAESLGLSYLTTVRSAFRQHLHRENPVGHGGGNSRGGQKIFCALAAQPRDHRPARRQSQSPAAESKAAEADAVHLVRLPKRPAGAGQTRAQPAAGEHPGLRAGRSIDRRAKHWPAARA